jgi:hypothetical protein
MAERLTRKQMDDKYPNQWLGIRKIEYKGRKIESAEVVYTQKTASELGLLSLKGEDVQPLFTTPDMIFQLGVVGGMNSGTGI